MNTIPAKITEIETEGQISLLRLEADGVTIRAIVIETPLTADYLKTGTTVDLLFKENEVILADGDSAKISIPNKFPCTIRKAEHGKLLTQLELDFAGHTITALLPADCADSIDLSPGRTVTAMVKINQITIAPHD